MIVIFYKLFPGHAHVNTDRNLFDVKQLHYSGKFRIVFYYEIT